MAKGMRNIMTGLGMTAVWLTRGTAAAADGGNLLVVVHVTDHARLEDAKLARARTEIDRIFEAIGVRVAWSDMKVESDRNRCKGVNLFVNLLSPLMVESLSSQGVKKNVLGSASSAAGRAFIYPERVSARAAGSRLDEGVLLGRVIAHEIGHLLLPGVKHSRSGLMAAGIETDPKGLEAMFMAQEARAIRTLLESKAGEAEQQETCGYRTANGQ